MEHKTQSAKPIETTLKRITKISCESPKLEFVGLIQHFTKENLIGCFHELEGKKAVGIDKVSKEEYGINLKGNIEDLICRMKALRYYPAPVREVKIPKGNGKYRSLGISNIEDKIIQRMYAKILNAIYEPHFIETSYGFRPGRSCHDAIKAIHKALGGLREGVIIDVDLSNFFGTINHRKLIQILELRIKDRTFIRYIVRMLRAGVLANGELSMSDTGTPQGSIVSPILSNIFAHYCLDLWITHEIPKFLHGEARIVRYADDFVIITNKKDAPRILKALKGRLERFSLEINEEKTKVKTFSRPEFEETGKQAPLDFLGFTFYIDKSLRGKTIVKVKTASKTLSKKLKNVKEWIKVARSIYPLKELWRILQSKMRGHIQYYGVSFNSIRMSTFVHKSKLIFFKWINRRSQRKSFSWEKFSLFEKRNPLPPIRIVHKLF